MNSTELFPIYDISRSRGCLPASDPKSTFFPIPLPCGFSSKLEIIEAVGEALPTLLYTGALKAWVKNIPILDESEIKNLSERNAQLLMVRMAFIAHAYVWEEWGSGKARQSLPANLAVPLRALANRFGFCPTLNYSNYALWNWRRKDLNGSIVPENLKLIQNFLGGESEEWFVVIHVAIERAAAPLMFACWEIGDMLDGANGDGINWRLKTIAAALQNINALMLRMPEHCNPREYFQFVRPYLYAWKDKTIFPNGMLYEGKTSAENKYLVFPGETGAQSSIVPCLDRVLGVVHEQSPLSEHLHEMLHVCTQRKQRNFVLSLENRPSLSEKTAGLYGTETEDEYWRCRNLLVEFRNIHLGYASDYIQKQAHGVQKKLEYLGVEGSGGTQFMPSLVKHMKETERK